MGNGAQGMSGCDEMREHGEAALEKKLCQTRERNCSEWMLPFRVVDHLWLVGNDADGTPAHRGVRAHNVLGVIWLDLKVCSLVNNLLDDALDIVSGWGVHEE